jgi:uncharacterized ParB-like nuclease family protein
MIEWILAVHLMTGQPATIYTSERSCRLAAQDKGVGELIVVDVDGVGPQTFRFFYCFKVLNGAPVEVIDSHEGPLS